jgi:hypothetical protein
MTTPAPPLTPVCAYCHGVRLVGWSGAGPILCPECSRGEDAFTVITQAWREQRALVRDLESELAQLRRVCQEIAEARRVDGERIGESETALLLARGEIEELRREKAELGSAHQALRKKVESAIRNIGDIVDTENGERHTIPLWVRDMLGKALRGEP